MLKFTGGTTRIDTEYLNKIGQKILESKQRIEQQRHELVSLRLSFSSILHTAVHTTDIPHEIVRLEYAISDKEHFMNMLAQKFYRAAEDYYELEEKNTRRFSLTHDLFGSDDLTPSVPVLSWKHDIVDTTIPDSVEKLISRHNLGYEKASSILVEKIIRPDGSHGWVITVPGTEDFLNPLSANVHNITSCLLGIYNLKTALMNAIEKAMADAEISSQDPVLLNGHSLGGMSISSLADNPDFLRRYNIQGIINAGSPIGKYDIPSHIPVLSLEHQGDPVPVLDSRDNPYSARHVTVQEKETNSALLVTKFVSDISFTFNQIGLGLVSLGLNGLFGGFQRHQVESYEKFARKIDQNQSPRLKPFRMALKNVMPAGSYSVITRHTTIRHLKRRKNSFNHLPKFD